MEYVMVSNYKNITYGGEVIAGGMQEEYIVLKPNKKLNFAVAFRSKTIKKLIFLNGRKENYDVEELEADEIKMQDSILVRMKGGISFRGNLYEMKLIDWKQEDGFWLAPMEDENIVFWIPEDEIIQRFQKS